MIAQTQEKSAKTLREIINEHDLELIKNPAFLASKGINAFHNTSGNGGTL